MVITSRNILPATSRQLIRAVILCAILTFSPACDDGGSKQRKTQSAMVKSSGQFQKGYQDGSRDAQRALLDWRAADGWNWMADAQYKQGYNRGWADGRQMAKLKAHQSKQLGERTAPTPSPGLIPRPSAKQSETPTMPSSPKTSATKETRK